jgi:hypothetical protein
VRPTSESRVAAHHHQHQSAVGQAYDAVPAQMILFAV